VQLVFTFIPEPCSGSSRNTVRNHPGIAFILPRIPQLVELAQEHPRFGCPRLCVLVRREQRHNHKRGERLYREAGLSLRRKKRKRLVRQRVPTLAAQAANQEWALDFVTDTLASAEINGGRRIHARVLGTGDRHVDR